MEGEAGLVQRIEKCLAFIKIAPHNKNHVLELYKLLKEAPKQIPMLCDGIRLWPYPHLEFSAKLGDKYVYCWEQCLIIGHRYSLLDRETEISYHLFGLIFKGAFCFEMRQNGQEEPLRTLRL